MPSPKTTELRVLHLEDSELDHLLMLAHMRRGGLDIKGLRVETRQAFEQALEKPWDAVISDYNLPDFSGLGALEALKARSVDIPFLLVSGEISESTAVEAMRAGASDYLLKNNLARLVPALVRAVDAHRTRRARDKADRELNESRQRLRDLAQHLQTSIELERAAIAREIHDDVGGSLSALKFDLAWINRRVRDGDVRERVAGALETVSHALEASQRIMHNLRPAILEQGLLAALQWMAERFERRTGTACVLRLPETALTLPPGVSLVAYRMAQEALTNVTKHAHATRVQIDLSLAGRVLSLEISDNGKGLGPDDLAKERSFGLRGLHERASTVGGWVDLSTGSSGTTLILSIPLDPYTDLPGAVPESEAGAGDSTDWGNT